MSLEYFKRRQDKLKAKIAKRKYGWYVGNQFDSYKILMWLYWF